MTVARALTAAAFLVGGGCSMPSGPAATETDLVGVERESYAVPGMAGLRVSYLRAGSRGGRRIVFVHGTPGSADGWADFLLNVPPGFEYVAIDRPGFGATVPDSAEPSLRRQAQALAPLLDRKGDHGPILVGHSLGGPIIARVAVDQPGRVGGLLILAGSLDPALERIHPLQPVGEWWGLRSLVPRRLRNANRELLPLKRELEALAPRLREIRVPVTIVHGTADTLVPVENVQFMKPRFAQATPLRTVLLDGQNHFLPWEHRPAVERALADMVRG